MSAGEGHSASFFSFAPSCLLPALSCPYYPVVSYRLRPVEALRGGASWRGRYALTGCGLIWLLVPPSHPIRPVLRFVRFPHIGLRACGGVRRFCQLVFITRLCSSPFVIRWRLVVSFSFSSRPSSRLPVSCGRLVSILCGSLIYPFHLVDLPVSRCSVSLGGPSLVPPSCSSFLGVLSCPAYRLPSFRPASR